MSQDRATNAHSLSKTALFCLDEPDLPHQVFGFGDFAGDREDCLAWLVRDMNKTRVSLLPLLTAGFYVLWTLLPDSHRLMMKWPWVALGQMAWLCPVLWLMVQLFQGKRPLRFGQGWDLGFGLAAGAIGWSMAHSAWQGQSQWSGWVALAGIGAFYALSRTVANPRTSVKLLQFQGYLSCGLIALRLGLWLVQTWYPTSQRLNLIERVSGVRVPFDFVDLTQRNWAPLGDQNDGSGYLCLAIPLLLGLGAGSGKKVFWVGAGLGVIDLYTTSSRSGWFGLMVGLTALVAYWVKQRNFSKWRVRIGAILGVGGFLTWMLSRQGWHRPLTALAHGQVPGDLADWLITIATGWRMGAARPFTGIGPGNVPQLYQQYRPLWGGWVAEQAYQLHSLPIQIWAELGLPGVVALVALIALLVRQFRLSLGANPRDWLTLGLFVGILAYGVQSLWEYQLDNPAIAGLLIVVVASLAMAPRAKPLLPVKTSKPLAFVLVGLVLLGGWAVLSTDLAWAKAHGGGVALDRAQHAEKPEDRQAAFQTFVTALKSAQTLQPKNPYYSQQLAWVLGDLGLKTSNADLVQQSIAAFDLAQANGPPQAFSPFNQGWLLLQRDPKRATQAFIRTAQILPTKRGLYYGLGLSLLYQGNVDLAVEAIALEALRDPLFIASPLWQQPAQKALYVQVLKRMNALYDSLGTRTQDSRLKQYLNYGQTSLAWWRGDRAFVEKQLQAGLSFPEVQMMLDLQDGKPPRLETLDQESSRLAVTAWIDRAHRPENLLKAWVTAQQSLPPKAIWQQIHSSMDQSKSFDQWLRSTGRPYRRERSGFGVLSRNLEGITPQDFTPVADNIVLVDLVKNLLRSDPYNPPLEKMLLPLRRDLLRRAS